VNLLRSAWFSTRPSVTVMGILSAAWLLGFGAVHEAAASCGDYLSPPHQIAQQQTLPAELVASGVNDPHRERPCRGPHCRRSPRHDLPTPAPVTVVVTDHWACPLSTAGRDLPRVSLRTSVEAVSLGREESFRLDRPPRG
jgi:hypothetical protein